MDDEKNKKQKVTTFKLTEELTNLLTKISHRDGCTKDAAIRRMIMLGIETDSEIQGFKQDARKRVAAREVQDHKRGSKPSSVG